MFIGHYAVGFASKRLAPRASLGVLMAAPLLADLLWPIALLTGLESVRIDPGNTVVTPLDFQSYPYTHSLAMSIVWSVLYGVGFGAITRYWRGAWVVGLGVFSHWIFDFVTHRPDLPLYPGSDTYLGLGLWNSLAGTLVVELGLFLIGLWLYERGTRPRNRRGSVGLSIFVGLLLLIYIGNLFGSPPPSAKAVAITALGQWLFVLWAWWMDRNREPAIK